MGSCCGAAADVTEDDPLEVPPRGRDNTLPAESAIPQHTADVPATNPKDKKKTKPQESFTALGTLDSQERRPSRQSRKSSDTGSLTNGCTPTRTTTAALSHPGGTTPSTAMSSAAFNAPVEPGQVAAAAAAAAAAAPLPPAATTFIQGMQSSNVRPPNANAREGGGAEGLLSDVFHISASSSSSSMADHDALSTSLVELSQATQTIRNHDRTHSEFDATSEWAETSMDRTAGRRRSQSRLVDRNRLQHLLMSESEARLSVTQMYLAQHRRALVRCVKEQYIEQRVAMLREHQAEQTALCVAWLQQRERAAREVIAREWWAERAALAWRTSVTSSAVGTTSSTTTPAGVVAAAVTAPVPVVTELSTEATDHAKRDDSLMHFNSHTGRDGELSSSEVTTEDDNAAEVRSPSVRFTAAATTAAAAAATAQLAHSAPCASRLALAEATRSPSTSADAMSMTALTGSVSAPLPQQPHSYNAVRKVSSAQQALRDRIGRVHKATTEALNSL